MPSVDNIYRSAFLKAVDIRNRPGEKAVGTIKVVTVQTIGDEQQEKLVVEFHEPDLSSLVLNATNAKLIAANLGDQTENWTGARIEIGVRPVSFRGTITDGLAVLRVAKLRAAAPAAQKAAPVPPPPPTAPLEDFGADDVPF
jgi:hypothetical protein